MEELVLESVVIPRKIPPKRQVLGLRVSSDSNQGGRDHMEDLVSIRFERGENDDCAFFGVFDGHGGREAAVFARDMLWDTIKEQRGFDSKDPAKVKQAINDGFLKTQEAMWKKRGNWCRTKSGYPSTAGTTACIAIIRGRQMWVAHVGDSRAVLGMVTSCQTGIRSRTLTTDHKPELPKEVKRIEALGGKVQAKNGVKRVVWERTKLNHSGPVRRSTNVDQIPFLAVARSLGDLWSYSTLYNDYVVSPVPDISHHILKPKLQHCLVLGSDGLWNMLSSSEAISIFSSYIFEKKKGEQMRETIAQRLVKNSINRWVTRCLRADNTTAVTVVFEFPRETTAEASESLAGTSSREGASTSVTDTSCTEATGNETGRESPDVCTTPLAEDATVGTKLHIRGDTDFVGLQGFGSCRPKLRRSNAFRDHIFKFWYEESEKEKKVCSAMATPWRKWARSYNDIYYCEEDFVYDDEPFGKIDPDGVNLINFPHSEAMKLKKPKSKPHGCRVTCDPWVDPNRAKQTAKRPASFATWDNPEPDVHWSQRKIKTKIVYDLDLSPKKKRKRSESLHKRENDGGKSGAEEAMSWSAPNTRSRSRLLLNSNPADEETTDTKMNESENPPKPNASPKRKVDGAKTGKPGIIPARQKVYNTRNSPTEPEIPVAQRALRSLNKSATYPSSKAKPLHKRRSNRPRLRYSLSPIKTF